MPDITESRTKRTKISVDRILFVEVVSDATRVQAGYSLVRDGSPQELAKLGHAMVWNRVNSFPLAVVDGHWSRMDLIFSGPAKESVTVNQWIENAAGTKIREWSQNFKQSANSYGWMEWRVEVV